MTKPWEISTEELQEWASRFEAAAILPRLVRRLLFATSPLDGIAMRADAGTRYEGWDGIVRGPRGGTTFCPAGLSVWELSVEKKVRMKLNEDYVKRSQKPPEGVRPALATYRSKEAEDAIEQAAKAIEDSKVTKKRGRAIHKGVRHRLPGRAPPPAWTCTPDA